MNTNKELNIYYAEFNDVKEECQLKKGTIYAKIVLNLDYQKALSSANKEIEKLRKEIMISGGDALMKIQEKVGLKQQLKTQRDDMFKEIELARQCIQHTKGLCDNKDCKNYYCSMNKEHLKQTHKIQPPHISVGGLND